MTRHRPDPLSLVLGALSVGLAVIVLLRPDRLVVEDLRIAGPVILLAVGLAALASATGGRARPAADAPAPSSPTGTGDHVDADATTRLDADTTTRLDADADATTRLDAGAGTTQRLDADTTERLDADTTERLDADTTRPLGDPDRTAPVERDRWSDEDPSR